MIKMADPIIKEEEIAAVNEVLKSGNIAAGKKVAQFEQEFATYVDKKYAVATNSGTSALHTALLACGVARNHEVIVPAFSFFATAMTATACNAELCFVDVGLDGNLNVEEVEDNITSDTRAVVAVNLYGKIVDEINVLETMCKDYNIFLIVDSCQCPSKEGARYGDVSCFSFYATKNITTGEGGMIVTNNKGIEENSRMCINHGQKEKYIHTNIGFNYRMTDISAAIGIEQLKRLDAITKRRREIAMMYEKDLKLGRLQRYPVNTYPLNGKPEITDTHVFHQYVIIDENRTHLSRFLEENGIQTAVHYPKPIPRQPFYNKFYKDIEIPTAEMLSDTVLSLPCHPGLTDEDVAYVIEKANEFFVGIDGV